MLEEEQSSSQFEFAIIESVIFVAIVPLFLIVHQWYFNQRPMDYRILWLIEDIFFVGYVILAVIIPIAIGYRRLSSVERNG